MTNNPIIGYDAKRIVKNGTGLGSYGRTLVNDLAAYPLQMRLYAPDKGRDDLREQIVKQILRTRRTSLSSTTSCLYLS